MFQGLFKRAESTIDSVVSKFVMRALVAIPLIVAAGFATAALTIKLVEQYGAVTGHALMAALFAMIGLVTLAVVGFESAPAAEQPNAHAADTATTQNVGSEDPASLLTPEIRAFLSSAAPMALPGIARGVGRNLPLILMLALVAFVVSRFVDTAGEETAEATPEQNAASPPAEAA
ncbi:hypothetical protein [Hyphomicrobium sp.]|uniref:hypothetical protein n=1 Tax=Hyphomicrobium sp. TaxID=82 RepID=UPI002E2FD07F|nr:hypothetical protein [Hyphomicrobium sp.]HEX2841809.1 hypothetical protein [Hyphomicrobium sp.]